MYKRLLAKSFHVLYDAVNFLKRGDLLYFFYIVFESFADVLTSCFRCSSNVDFIYSSFHWVFSGFFFSMSFFSSMFFYFVFVFLKLLFAGRLVFNVSLSALFCFCFLEAAFCWSFGFQCFFVGDLNEISGFRGGARAC